MTIECFAHNKNKKIETVLKWIYDGFIPGSSVDNDYVPNSAREPYVKARVKTADAIYSSIVNASRKLKHVTYKTYGISEKEFNGYINRLVNANLIELRIEDNVTYYDVTVLALGKKKAFILDCIEHGLRGISEGITNGVKSA